MFHAVYARALQASFLAGVLALALGINYLSAWTGAPGTFPTCPPGTTGCDAPINVGATGQIKSGGLTVGSLVVSNSQQSGGEVRSTLGSSNANFRMTNGATAYGSLFRNDGANTYLLLTANNDPMGTWNGLRPLYVNDATGMVNLDNGVTVRGSGVTFPDGTVQASAVNPAATHAQVIYSCPIITSICSSSCVGLSVSASCSVTTYDSRNNCTNTASYACTQVGYLVR